MPEPESENFSARRVANLTGILVIAGGLLQLLVRRSPEGALSLTGAGLVAIINFRWLEGLLQHVIQPGRPRIDRRSGFRFLGRMLLFGAVLAALFWVPRVDFVAVAFGFSALVLALLIEGVRWARAGGE
jgi:hypothetical protein